MGSIKEEKSKI